MGTPSSADDIARSLADEIVRQGVIDLLDQRWSKCLTLVTAPGGYGKTRSLAQAVRSNAEDPVGVEFYLRLRPAHLDASRFGVAILQALGADADRVTDHDPLVDLIVDRFASMSPSKVCLILDDVHLIGGSVEAVDLLSELVRSLPTNSHLLLAGRTIPELPLARLRADDGVVDVGPEDLVFGADEIDLLAERYDVDPELLAPLAGWPALIRLAVVAGKTGPQDFLMQEIIDDLAPHLARGLRVASIAGIADDELFSRCGIDVSSEQLAERVPLVDLSPNGQVRPHELWSEVADRIATAERDASDGDALDRDASDGDASDGESSSSDDHLIRTIAQWHTEHLRHDEAVMLAAQRGQPDLARSVLMDALDGSDLLIRAASTGRWLDVFGGGDAVADDDPELLLLRGWHARLSAGPGHGDDDVTAALALFHERGDALGEARASVEHAFRGFLAGEVGPVLDAVDRSPRLTQSGVGFLQPLGEMTKAIIAELSGDFHRALEHSLRALEPGPRREFAELTLRHRATLYFLVGDGPGAVTTATNLVEHTPSAANDTLLAITKFANGDIADLVDRWHELRYFESGNIREDYTFAVASVFVDACLGLEPDLTLVRSAAWERPRERFHLALCEWSAEIIAGRESAANERLRAEIAELGADDALVAGEIRRYLVSVYVADPTVRDILDKAEAAGELGAYHLERLALARLLLSLRQGTPPQWSSYVSPASTIASMSLPWAVEIACGLTQHDLDLGLEFADALFATTGVRTQYWLRTLADSDSAVAPGASQLLAVLPAPPAEVTHIVTQNHVGLSRAGTISPVTRTRVRQLLLLLVLRPSVSRDTVMTALWPDKDIDKARNNLRITLSHLRDELEPNRLSGEPSYHLRQRGAHIVLRRSDYLTSDLWQLLDGLAASEAVSPAGDRALRLAALAPVAGLWQPPLLMDLIDVPDVSSEIAALQAQVRDATVEVGEAYLSAGDYDRAEKMGAKLLIQDRFDERAHAIVIAAFLGAGRQSQAQQAIDECLLALDELDVSPAAATRMLFRRARYREDVSRRTA